MGSLKKELPPGTVVIADDYFNLWNIESAYSDERAHIAPALDSELRKKLQAIAPNHREGVYVQTRGPRFETRAEVRFLATLGEVVGMTGASEATHCQEAGLAYAMLCMVDNFANGISTDELSLEAFRAAVKENESTVQDMVEKLLK